ncbi:hypothetical protein D3C76_10420 [compost metagenome]
MIFLELRKKFLEAGIPYDELDVELIEVLDLLNFKLGIKTKYCCCGHKEFDRFYIMFHEDESFEKIEKFAEEIVKQMKRFTFNYWVRSVGSDSQYRVLKNWVCETTLINTKRRKEVIDEFTSIMNKM